MVSEKHYLEIAQKYGAYSSWAVWANEGSKPKSNIGDMSLFDLSINPTILSILNPHIIMVGLNFSRAVNNTPFSNFHDGRPQSQDFKLRFAFSNTPYYGAYMTDIIKDFEEKISGNVRAYLNENNGFELHNIDLFNQELADLQSKDPLIIAFGNMTYDILKKHFDGKYCIQKVMHYSQQINKEKYKAVVWDTLNLNKLQTP
jgi:hypothetical protein